MKYQRFCKIIVTISHDEYGLIYLDAIIAVHDDGMQKGIEEISQHVTEYDDEPTISEITGILTRRDSQECVDDVIYALNDTISVTK